MQRARAPAPRQTVVQPALRIGPVDDPHEREADRIADQIMRMPTGSSVRPSPTSLAPTVQRKCSACEETQRSGLVQREGSGTPVLSNDTSAAIADLRSSGGQSLDSGARAFFEPRFGHDFSNVRVHTDGRAAEAARSVQARAFTIGSDVVFGAGEHRPDTPAGKRLLAHELTHVIQQSGSASTSSVQRSEDSVAPKLRTGPVLQRDYEPRLFEPLRLNLPHLPPPPLIQPGSLRETWVIPQPILPAPIELEMPTLSPTPGPRRPRLGPDFHIDPSLNFTPVLLIPVPRCIPDRPLTWADFPGTNVPGGFGGVTRMATPQIVVDGNPMFQAQLLATSAVVAAARDPSNRATNGCQPAVNSCRAHLGSNPGATWSTRRPNPDRCPASPVTINTATTPDQCESIIGAGCDADKVADSTRLLAHEQVHFDIACVMVGKANDALIAGTHTPAQLVAWLRTNLQAQQNRYDSRAQTNHGCNAGSQANWAAAVAGGLPAVTLPAGRAPNP